MRTFIGRPGRRERATITVSLGAWWARYCGSHTHDVVGASVGPPQSISLNNRFRNRGRIEEGNELRQPWKASDFQPVLPPFNTQIVVTAYAIAVDTCPRDFVYGVTRCACRYYKCTRALHLNLRLWNIITRPRGTSSNVSQAVRVGSDQSW